jgi:hypothetical protein
MESVRKGGEGAGLRCELAASQWSAGDRRRVGAGGE